MRRTSAAARPASGPRKPPVPVKILVAGGFGAGKTTLIGALSEIEPLTTEAAMTTVSRGVDLVGAAGEAKSTTTVALDFGRVTIDDSLIMYLFGTPGQERFAFMWRDLSSGALGGVVLIDTDRVEDCFVAIDYFEQIGLPFVLVINEFEGQEWLTEEEVRAATDVDDAVPVISIDVRQKEAVKTIMITLIELVLARARRRAAGRR